MLHKRTESPRKAYAAWLNAAAEAHRSGDVGAKAVAERLYIESKAIERRSQRSRARLTRN